MAKKTQFKVPTGIVVWPHVFEPRVWSGDVDDDGKAKEPKREITLVFEDRDEIKAFEDACLELAEDEFGRVKGIKLPLRETDEVDALADVFPGAVMVKARTIFEVGVCGPDFEPIKPRDVYSGCLGRMYVELSAYTARGSKGISANLKAFQKVADGDELELGGGTVNPADVWGKDDAPRGRGRRDEDDAPRGRGRRDEDDAPRSRGRRDEDDAPRGRGRRDEDDAPRSRGRRDEDDAPRGRRGSYSYDDE